MSNFYAENIKIKKILEDIVDYAYPGSEKLAKYKSFYFKISDKNVSSYAGMYHPQGHLIEIVGLNRDSKHIVFTCIHELSHHIDHVNRNTSDHGKEFYAIYEKLLHTALNMRIFTPDDATMEDVTDSNKIRKMIDNWRPSFIDYKKDEVIIEVNNSFSIKEILKNRGYKYNSLQKTWYIEISDANKDREKEWLLSLGLKNDDISTTESSDVSIKARLKIEVRGNSYPYRDYLKENNFRYSDKKWYRYVDNSEDVNELINIYKQAMPDCRITYKV